MWLAFVHPPHSSCTKCLTTTCAPGAGRFVLELGSRCAQLTAVLALPAAAVSLKHPALSNGLSVAAFPVLLHFLATFLHCRPSGQPKCLCVPMAGDVGNAWALSVGAGQHLELRVGSLLPCSAASSPVYLHHLTNGSPPWVLDGVSRPNCRGKRLVWPSAHLGTSSCLPDPRGYEPGRRLSSREGGWTPALDLTSWTSICIFRCRSQPVGCLRPPHSLFKGPERSGRTCRHCLCGIQWPPDACPQALRSLRPWSQGEWGREVPVAWAGDCLLKTEGCSGWGRLWGDLQCWRGGRLLRVRLSYGGAPGEPTWGGSHFGEDTLAFSSEHLRFVPRSFSSGKRSLSCFLVFWKVVPVRAGSKSRNQSMHLLTQQGKGCISRSILLGAAPPSPVALGRLQGGAEATHGRLPWPGTVGSAPTFQISSGRMVVLEALGKWRGSCQL